MKQWFKAIIYMPVALPFVIAAFYILIWYSQAIEICKLTYYKLFKIEYIKLNDKFHPVYLRTDKFK